MAITKVTRNMLTTGIVDNSNATAITIDSSENVGIGYASPNAKFVVGTASGQNIEFFPENATDTNLLQNYDRTASAYQKIETRAAEHIFSIGSSEKMRIASDGKVGIGTTAPGDKLHVRIGTNLNWHFGYPSSNTTSLVALNDAEGAYVEARIDASPLSLNSQSGGNVGIGTTSPSQKLHVVGKIKLTDDLIIGGTSPRIDYDGGSTGALRFFSTSANAERMRILSTGLIAIGTTVNTVAKTHIVESESRDCLRLTNTRNPSSSAPYVATFGFNYQPNNGTSYFLNCKDDLDGSPTARCIIQSNGGIANYQSNDSNLSDARLKTDIQDAPNALDIINNLKVRTFKYHDQTDEKIHTGLIAQETETVDLSLVNQDGWADKAPDGEEPYKSIYNTDLMFKMLKAIQELTTKLEAAEARITTLEG